MYNSELLKQHIQDCVHDLETLVQGLGKALTDSEVVQKSMELDELILISMRNQVKLRKAGKAS
jgi:hypothetical protein